MSLPENQYVRERKIAFCPTLASLGISRLIVECHKCRRYLAACCVDKSFGGDLYQPDKPRCHSSQLVFTDGACSNNGYAHAKAGLGISIGGHHDFSWSIPVDDSIDFDAPRTNQRAELLAAIEGLRRLEQISQLSVALGRVEDHRMSNTRHRKKDGDTYIVVTDSEYVVKGITEWFPAWRRRGWRTSDGRRPTNLDLFQKLDEYVTDLEKDSVVVGFWHVPRAFNHEADALAKRAVSI